MRRRHTGLHPANENVRREVAVVVNGGGRLDVFADARACTVTPAKS